jgi:hypothetical protein
MWLQEFGIRLLRFVICYVATILDLGSCIYKIVSGYCDMGSVSGI